MKQVIAFTIIVLGNFGCAHGNLPSWAPEPPAVWKCSYTHQFNKFRCTNTKTNARINLKLDDPRMEGAQCMSLGDYNAGEDWVDKVFNAAQRNCNR